MAIKHIAAAMITPAAIAGIALSTGGAASAATAHQAAGQHAAQGKYHRWVTVQDGDTLSGIAAAHRMSWPALYEANRARIADPDVLTTGESLRIPADPALWAAEYTPPAAPAQPAATQAPARDPRPRDPRPRDPRPRDPRPRLPRHPAAGRRPRVPRPRSSSAWRGGKAPTFPPSPTGSTGSCRRPGHRLVIPAPPARRPSPSRMPRSTSSMRGTARSPGHLMTAAESGSC